MCTSLGYSPWILTFPSGLIFLILFCLARARAYARRLLGPVLKVTPEESDDCKTSRENPVNLTFWTGIFTVFTLLFTVRRCSFLNFIHIMRDQAARTWGFSTNSETGEYPASGLSSQQYPTVKRAEVPGRLPSWFKASFCSFLLISAQNGAHLQHS